jgi:uncharacterized protein (TIGR02145 family)
MKFFKGLNIHTSAYPTVAGQSIGSNKFALTQVKQYSKHLKILFSLSVALLSGGQTPAQNVGIGTTIPAASAQLDVTSTKKGLLPPRLTGAQRDSIVGPVAGLMVWCSNCGVNGEMQVFNGSRWTNMIGGATTSVEAIICNQSWTIHNLDVTTYRNGDAIPKITDDAAWSSLTTGAYCYYNNDSATYAATYGKLYNWYAVNDPRGLAPAGWHIPSDAEWTILENCLGGSSVCGGAMKETGLAHWMDPNQNATNSSGFTGLPGGFRDFDGPSVFIVNYGGWWSSTQSDAADAWIRRLGSATGSIFIDSYNKRNGFSVRCLRD